LAALGFAIGACASLAQGAYPNRPINILTPTTAGSGMEVQLRLIS
jgi:tripartite-type tricarboxylate transporter receptor subunit TctC